MVFFSDTINSCYELQGSYTEAFINLARHPVTLFNLGAMAALAVSATNVNLRQTARKGFHVLGGIAFVSTLARLTQLESRTCSREELGTLVLLTIAEISLVAAAVKFGTSPKLETSPYQIIAKKANTVFKSFE